MSAAEPLGVWFKKLDKNEKQVLVNDLKTDDFKKTARNLGFANWNNDEVNELEIYVSKWNEARQYTRMSVFLFFFFSFSSFSFSKCFVVCLSFFFTTYWIWIIIWW